MEREANKDTPSFLSNSYTKEAESLKKPLSFASGDGGGGGGGDRLKRDEWSEGAVSTLLDTYESKWVLRNRAKLKGHDWEDVGRCVSSRSNSTKSSKTQTQCKNKIESMKKRYRSESASVDASSWPLFPRLDLLLRCRAHPPPSPNHPPLLLLDQQPPSPPPPETQQDSHEANGVKWGPKEDGTKTKLFGHGADKIPMERDSSSPVSDSDREKLKSTKKMKMKMKMEKKKRRRREDWEVAESVRWLAEVVLRSEQARMETMRELERMRVEAEAKRGEMDLKRTEIMANTQLQIAQLLAGNGKGADSSLRIGRS
ncbi:hypothetical protein HHK36_017166 [Tetracentron sinense]|uniref:Myb/SANT-like DNA-binding domain-containing protein n=1 Tax=Tetracentron sinense TaxID=13715 RepID=A0A834Z0V8_TETSI|nr:hypothetical protein HHK36_017166 [Tetracentron sinense]